MLAPDPRCFAARLPRVTHHISCYHTSGHLVPRYKKRKIGAGSCERRAVFTASVGRTDAWEASEQDWEVNIIIPSPQWAHALHELQVNEDQRDLGSPIAPVRLVRMRSCQQMERRLYLCQCRACLIHSWAVCFNTCCYFLRARGRFGGTLVFRVTSGREKKSIRLYMLCTCH